MSKKPSGEKKPMPQRVYEAYQQGRADGYSKAENDYFSHSQKDREDAYNCGYDKGKADAIDEYNGYRRKVIEITTTEDFRQLKRVATIDILENLIKELSQEDLLRVILDEIAEQMQKEKDSAPDLGYNPYQE